MSKLPQEIVDLFKKPLPKEALKPHPSKPYLTTINPIYVVERFNDGFGTGGWKLSGEVIDKDSKMVVVRATFTVEKYSIHIEQFGGNDNPDRGDAFKGAMTDALTKIGSYLGIGADVWKDKGPKGNPPPVKDQDPGKGEPQTCEKCGAPKKISQAGKSYCSAICWKDK